PDRSRAAAHADIDADLQLLLLHVGAHLRLVVGGRDEAVLGGPEVAEPHAHGVAIDRLVGAADRHDDAAPVGVLAGEGGLDQRALGDGAAILRAEAWL